ncbi:MAG: hypothetical protein NC928_00620 [Candidatus Omnitrophica bacterium]|nr:hypothetical protein [Candidatus Omnitrophota bacterium]
MSVGKKGADRGVFRFPRALPDEIKGLTLVEVLVVAFIWLIVIAALFMVLNIGYFSNDISSTKMDLQSEVRRVIDCIIKDVRQAVSWEMANNNPSVNYIKFRQVEGVDTSTGDIEFSSNYIEYIYDANLSKITRRLLYSNGEVIQSMEFNNIIKAPFSTRDPTNGEIVPLESETLLNSRKLIVEISGQRQVRGTLNIDFTLKGEIKIRNGG